MTKIFILAKYSILQQLTFINHLNPKTFISIQRTKIKDFRFQPQIPQALFNSTKYSQRQLTKRSNLLYLWPRSKVWIQAGKRAFKPPRLKSQIQEIASLRERLFINELNSNKNPGIFSDVKSVLGLFPNMIPKFFIVVNDILILIAVAGKNVGN